MTLVCNISPATWQRIQAFAYDKRLGTPDMLKAVSVATKLPIKIPTDKQALLCIELKNIVEAEGFKE